MSYPPAEHRLPTPGDNRPMTARTPSSPGYEYPQHDPQYTYSQEEAADEWDESEDEDVFAYVPPTTAELDGPQKSQQHHTQELDSLSERPQTKHGESSYMRDRPPAFDDSVLPSSHHHTHTDSFPSTGPPITPFSHLPVETPPSTDSQSDPNDPYRLRRINSTTPTTAPATSTYTPPTTGTGGSAVAGARLSLSRNGPGARGVRVELPPLTGESEMADNEKSLDLEAGQSGHSRAYSGKERPLSEDSATASMSVTPSMLEYADVESRESIKMGFDLDAVDEEDSPYPEVRASVSNVDDPEMPALTFRMWAIGLVLCMLGSAMNVFFNFRQPAPQVVPLVLVLVSYPLGKLAAFTLPIKPYRVRLPIPWPKRYGGHGWKGFDYTFSLNPGPWNIKEHVLVYIMANVAVGSPYALNAVVVAEIYYKIKLGFWFNLVLVLATQLTGFGLAGLCRRFLVWPASMVWPQNLVACTLLNTLHAEDDAETGGITRYKYYFLMTIASFAFFFLPGFLFGALSLFSWVCWIAPKNVPVNQLFGTATGLGMSVLTFDWTQISWVGSPLMVPWWAEVHVFFGFVLFYWIIVPVLYYKNVWQLAHFPISDTEPYDRFGHIYNVSLILQPDNRFNLTAYEEYSPLYLPATYAMTYLLAFALSTCVIVHTLLYHGRSMLNGVKNMRVEKDDIHAKLMRNYPEVPDWWYGLAFIFFFGLAIVAAEVWHTGVPVWALLISVALPIVYVLPSGFIFAMTGQGITLNLLAQIVPGTVLPGNPLANMVFKAYSVQTLTEATMFVQDLKLGHYIKVPPRATFLVQLLATILAAFVQVGVKEWMFANVADICQEHQASSLTCPHNQVFFTASAVWGLIGPTRQFGTGTLYHPQLYAMIVGALLPIPFWLWQRRRPDSWIKYVSTPIILNGTSFIPPATGINYSSWFFVGFIFQYVIRRRNFGWWSKFNYVTSAALDSGTVISLMFIFFTLQFPKGGKISVNWWGNEVFMNTADWNKTALLTTPDKGL